MSLHEKVMQELTDGKHRLYKLSIHNTHTLIRERQNEKAAVTPLVMTAVLEE